MAHQWVTFAPIYVNPDKNKQDWIIIESAINWLLIRLIIHLSVSFITQVWLHIRVLYSWPLPHFLGSPSTRHCTGSRGDVFVVRTSNRSKTSEKWVILITLQFRYTFYRLQTKRLRARKIGLQYTLLTRHLVPRLPFGRRAVRQRGYGLRLLIFKMANNKVDLGQIRSVYSRFMRL